MPEDVRKYTAIKIQPRPFRVVEFDCRCSCRHFNSGECIICILAVRPLRASTMSPGSNGHRRVSQPSDRCGQRALSCLFFPPFSRVVARQIRIKGERIREEIPKTDGERSKSYVSLATRRFRRLGWVYSHEKEIMSFKQCSFERKLERAIPLSEETMYNENKTPVSILRMIPVQSQENTNHNKMMHNKSCILLTPFTFAFWKWKSLSS